MTCLRRILGIRWLDKVSDIEVFSRACLPSVHTLLMRAQTLWAGHVICMLDKHIPNQLLFRELYAGKCLHGWQNKHYKDTLKASLNFENRHDYLGNVDTKLPYLMRPHLQRLSCLQSKIYC